MAVYRPSYVLTQGEKMTLEEKYRTLFTDTVDKKVKEVGTNEEFLANLVGAAGACIVGLAAEIDLLRSDLVAKGLLESA